MGDDFLEQIQKDNKYVNISKSIMQQMEAKDEAAMNELFT